MGTDVDGMPKILDIGKCGLEFLQLIGARPCEFRSSFNVRDEVILGRRGAKSPLPVFAPIVLQARHH